MKLKNVLLVDDDEGFNFLNRLVFNDNQIDCDVHEAMNGKAAMDYLEKSQQCPDVILLDINMPIMDGFEFLERFEKYNKCSHNIYVLTSSGREEDKIKSMANKVVKGFFNKPLTSQHVQQIMAAAGN